MNAEEKMMLAKQEKRRRLQKGLYRDLLNIIKEDSSKNNKINKNIYLNVNKSKIKNKLKELNALDYRACVNNKIKILYFYKIELNTIKIITLKTSDKNDEVGFDINCFRIKCVIKTLREELMTIISQFALSKEVKLNKYIKL